MTEINKSVVFAWLPSPLGGMALVQQGFFDSFFNFCTHDTNNRKIFGGYTWASMGYIPAGRSSLIRTFLDKTQSEMLLMLDWDIGYTPEDVYTLVDSSEPGKIVSGCYVTYLGDDKLLRPCWFEEGEDDAQNLVSEFKIGEMIQLATCGMGFTLFYREDLLKIEAAHKDDPWPWFGHDIIGENRTGEDLTMCKRARDLGITIWGHGGVQLEHTKSKTFIPKDMENPALARSGTPTKKVLNVGGGSKSFALPMKYWSWEHILLDINPNPDVDIVMDAKYLAGPKGLKGYDLDGTLTAGIIPLEPFVVISGRTSSEDDETVSQWRERTEVYLRGDGEYGDREDAARFKAEKIKELGVVEFFEDDPLQADIIRKLAPNCLVTVVGKSIDASFDAVFCSHTIEHFEMWDIPTILDGFMRVLKPGGIVEIICPNFEEVFHQIDEGKKLDDIAYESFGGPIRYRDILFGWDKEIEGSGNSYYLHRTAITPAYLEKSLDDAGFIEKSITLDGLELIVTAEKSL